MRIYLIGFMGCGKSTAGKKISALMNFPLLDTDKLIESLELKTVSQVFSEKGETYFRELERKILFDTTLYDDAIISCGGGMPCFYDNMEWMKQNGVPVYLKGSESFLFNRLVQKKAKRPLIANYSDEDLKIYIQDTLKKREKYYNEADIIFPAEDFDPNIFQSVINNFLHQ